MENSIPDSLDCIDSKYCYQPVGHIVTGDLKIITDQEFGLLYVRGLNIVSCANRLQIMN